VLFAFSRSVVAVRGCYDALAQRNGSLNFLCICSRVISDKIQFCQIPQLEMLTLLTNTDFADMSVDIEDVS